MLPINNSDTAWLIVSDYNQENDKYYEELRDDIDNPEVNDWHINYRLIGVGSAGRSNYLSSANVGDYSRIVGVSLNMRDTTPRPGAFLYSEYVGGHRP